MAKYQNPFNDMLNKSIKELKANSKAVETAIEKLLEEEGIKVSESEFNKIRQLTDTMNELDSVLFKMETKKATPVKKAKKKVVKRKRR